MKPWTIVAYYTRETKYENEVESFKKSIGALNRKIKYVVTDVKNLGTWQKNTQFKPKYILDMLNTYPKYNIIYLDIDARLQQYPTLFDTLDCDIACHFRKKKGQKHIDQEVSNTIPEGELLSGTLYFANNAISRMILKNWITKCNSSLNRDTFDQKLLHETLIEISNKVIFRLKDLPPSYTKITKQMPEADEIVIEHFQASKKYKDKKTGAVK
jgi:hypothetical protein